MEIDTISPITFKRKLDVLSPRENKRMKRDKKRRIEEKPPYILEQNKKRAIVLISPKKKRKRHCMLQKKSLREMGPEFIEELKFLYYCQREDTSEEDSQDEGEMRKRCCVLEEDEPLSPESEAYTRARNQEFAEKALECYNKENDTKYILVDALDSKVIILDALWIHGNFTAKMDAESSPEIFFYEVYRSKKLPVSWTVIVCSILKGENTIGCHLCSKVIHPTQGFCRGYHPPTKAEVWSVNQLVSEFVKALVLPSN